MVALTPAQERNLRAALEVAPNDAMRVRLAFAIWTESRALILANSGLNTSDSPQFDTHPQWPAILRRSLLIPHDAIGNNGRSTGMLQQISAEVGGAWGPMVGTMDPIHSAKLFLTHLRVTENPIFTGMLQTPSGKLEPIDVELSDPIAADVLRVQQPLASEARSSNYDATQVATARAIVDQLYPNQNDWIIDMADQAALDAYRKQIVDGILTPLTRHIEDGVAFRLEEVKGKLDAIAGDTGWLRSNETFRDEDGNVSEPYSKTAANFNDVRGGFEALTEQVKALSEQVKALTNLVTQSLST